MTIQEFATAIQTVVASASGLSGAKVIWEAPNVERPARPFIALSILDDANDELLPEESWIDNPTPTPPVAPYPSQDPLLLQTTDRPEITVRMTAFTDAPKTGAISPAFALMKQVRRKMGMEATSQTLDPITVLSRGNVTNATVMLETGYEGRAVLDLKFGSIETESEGINTIETVKEEVTIKNLDGSTISDRTITLPNS